VRERAIPAALINAQIPNYSRQKDNRAFHEEVALLAYPRAIEVKHYRVAGFVGIRNIRHEAGVYRVASVALAGVVKIDNVKLRLYLVAVQVAKQVIVSDFRKVRKLIIIAVKRKTFLDLLFYVTVYHCIRLTAARRSQHKAGTERVHDIYPAVIPFLLIVEPGRQIYRILVLDKPCFLLETFVLGIKDIIHEVVFQQPGHPCTCHEHTDISHRQRGDIKHGIRRVWQRKFQQPPVQEKQSYSRRKAAMYLRPCYLFLFHALSADARQGEEHHRKKFRPKDGREQPGGTLEVPQYLVYHLKRHSPFFQGGVTEPVHVYSHE